MKIKSNTWALLANGARARVLKNLTNKKPEMIDFHVDQLKTGEVMSDKAGRSFSSADNRRAAMEPKADPVRNQERLFAKQLSDYLLSEFDKGNIGALIISASPQTLGDLRDVLAHRLQQIIDLETNHDLTQLTVAEQRERLLSLIKSERTVY